MVALKQQGGADGAARRFGLAAAAAFVPLIALTFFLIYRPSHEPTTDLIANDAQLLAAAAAALSCAAAAARAVRTDRAWILIAVAGAIAFARAAGVSAYNVLQAGGPPPPYLPDAAVLASLAFAIGGLLAFPRAPQYATRLRAGLDFAMVTLSIIFILGAMSHTVASPFARLSNAAIAVGLGYPVCDVILLTAIFVSLRGSIATHRSRMVVLCVGLAAIAGAESVSAVLSKTGFGPGYVIATSGSAYGLTTISLAPWFPDSPNARSEEDPALWQLMLPYVGAAAVAATAIYEWLMHGQIAQWEAVPGGGLLLVLITSQLVQHRESRFLLKQARLSAATIKQREAMLNQIIEHAPQGVAAIASDRMIIKCNPRLCALLGVASDALSGGKLDPYVSAGYVDRVFESLLSPDGRTDTYTADCRAQRSDGTEFWLHWSVTPIRKGDGSVDYYMAMFDDVTARREAEETAVANLAQLEQLNRLKSEFVYAVSHEFRTGLVGIQGFSELISDQETAPSEGRALAHEINTDAQRLSRLITEMLDFDRLEAGKVHLDLRPLDVNELAGSTIERARGSTTRHALKAYLQPHLPEILGDRTRLTEVLMKLLANAIKYSPDGTEIAVATRTVNASVELSVKDHGRGIPPEFVSRLFGRYERYEDKHAGKIIGTGLGLAIARQIVEMHGGKISVNSAVGRGSEFRIVIPVAAGRPTVPCEVVDRPAAGAGSNMSITGTSYMAGAGPSNNG